MLCVLLCIWLSCPITHSGTHAVSLWCHWQPARVGHCREVHSARSGHRLCCVCKHTCHGPARKTPQRVVVLRHTVYCIILYYSPSFHCVLLELLIVWRCSSPWASWMVNHTCHHKTYHQPIGVYKGVVTILKHFGLMKIWLGSKHYPF